MPTEIVIRVKWSPSWSWLRDIRYPGLELAPGHTVRYPGLELAPGHKELDANKDALFPLSPWRRDSEQCIFTLPTVWQVTVALLTEGRWQRTITLLTEWQCTVTRQAERQVQCFVTQLSESDNALSLYWHAERQWQYIVTQLTERESDNALSLTVRKTTVTLLNSAVTLQTN